MKIGVSLQKVGFLRLGVRKDTHKCRGVLVEIELCFSLSEKPKYRKPSERFSYLTTE